MGEWVIDLPWSRPPLNLNQRLHWAQKSTLTKEIRQTAFLLARKVPDMRRCEVELVWWVNDRRRRDTINPMPTLKALVDGLVDAEIIPDDSHEYVQTQVLIIYRPKSEGPAALMLRITEVDEDAKMLG